VHRIHLGLSSEDIRIVHEVDLPQNDDQAALARG
jgi:hypothetical protein